MSNPTIAVFQFRVDLETPCPRHIEIYRGEDALIRADLYQQNERVGIPAGATVRFYWQTASMREENQWWIVEGEVTDGAALAYWRPAMDSGAEGYQWFLAVEESEDSADSADSLDATGGTVCLRACGDITMAHGPGHANEVPLPTPVIDFATVEVLNAPWPAEIEAEAAARAEGDRLLGNRVDTVSAGLATHTADSVIHVTATDKSAWDGAVEGLGDKVSKSATGWQYMASNLRLETPGQNTGLVDLYADGHIGIRGAAGELQLSCERLSRYAAGGGTSTYDLPAQSGTLALAAQIPDITGKADKVTGATAGNFAGLDAAGNLVDSGKKASDFAAPADLPAAETWTFEVDDGQGGTETVTKRVAVYPAQQQQGAGA